MRVRAWVVPRQRRACSSVRGAVAAAMLLSSLVAGVVVQLAMTAGTAQLAPLPFPEAARAAGPGGLCEGVVVAAGPKQMPLPLANVTICGSSALTGADGRFAIPRAAGCSACRATVWARQYLPAVAAGTTIALQPRPIPGFPASDWKFEGWAVEAQTGDVPGSPGVGFLAHPSAYRPPSGERVFLTTTANGRAGPGWTQGYWQNDSAVRAQAFPKKLISGQNPFMHGTAFTGRMVYVDGRLLMLIGMGSASHPTSLLENKNLEDPSNPADWLPAEGNGTISVDFAGAPTTQHEDYRLHIFDQGFNCNGTNLKNWLFVIPDGVGDKKMSSEPHASASVLNNTNLRSGNLRSQKVADATACSQLCEATEKCQAWVFEAGEDICFLKSPTFCVNPANDTCGGCEHNGICPCTAGIKPNTTQHTCGSERPSHSVGRACGRMGFASANLNGPYKFCQWLEQPDPNTGVAGGPTSNCDSWPGDIIQSADGSLFFVNGWGNIYKAEAGSLKFKRLPGNATIARPAPRGSWDDLHQIEFTFLKPREKGGRWRLYHASYASTSGNAGAKKADYGYKQAIGMYSFLWDA